MNIDMALSFLHGDVNEALRKLDKAIGDAQYVLSDPDIGEGCAADAVQTAISKLMDARDKAIEGRETLEAQLQRYAYAAPFGLIY